MDIERGPVVNNVVLRRGHGDYTHFWMLTKQKITNGRSFSRVVESYHHEVRQRFLDALENLRLLFDFADNFTVGLISKSRENGFAHKARTVRHEDPDRLFHGTLPAR